MAIQQHTWKRTVDCKHRIMSQNIPKSILVLRCLKQQQKLLNFSVAQIALDTEHDTCDVLRQVELLGTTGYIPIIALPNDSSKCSCSYAPQRDAFICPMRLSLVYYRLNFKNFAVTFFHCCQI